MANDATPPPPPLVLAAPSVSVSIIRIIRGWRSACLLGHQYTSFLFLMCLCGRLLRAMDLFLASFVDSITTWRAFLIEVGCYIGVSKFDEVIHEVVIRTLVFDAKGTIPEHYRNSLTYFMIPCCQWSSSSTSVMCCIWRRTECDLSPVALRDVTEFSSVAVQNWGRWRHGVFPIMSVSGKVSGMLDSDWPIFAIPRNAVSQGKGVLRHTSAEEFVTRGTMGKRGRVRRLLKVTHALY